MTTANADHKGQYEGWDIYKNEGVPGLRPARPTSWFAVKGDQNYAAATRKQLLAGIDYFNNETDEDRAHTARIAAMLTA